MFDLLMLMVVIVSIIEINKIIIECIVAMRHASKNQTTALALPGYDTYLGIVDSECVTDYPQPTVRYSLIDCMHARQSCETRSDLKKTKQ